MPNGYNNRGVGYSEITFFEQVLLTHSAVSTFTRTNDIQFEIERTGTMPRLTVAFVSEYRLGESYAYSVIADFPNINVIVNNGNWNLVTLDRHVFKANTGVEVLQLKQFMGALNNASLGQ